ncbi:hypothetical protein JCM9279_002269 [Rhodotorula babjevae]
MSSEPASKRARRSDPPPPSTSTPAAAQQSTSDRLKSAVMSKLDDPKERVFLLTALQQTAAADDPCRTEAYFLDKKRVTDLRNRRRSALFDFFAPAIRTGVAHSSGLPGKGDTFTPTELWVDRSVIIDIYDKLGCADPWDITFRRFKTRVETAYRVDKEESERSDLAPGTTYSPKHDWVAAKLRPQVMYARIEKDYYGGAAPDADRGFDHDHEQLLEHPAMVPLVARWTSSIHEKLHLVPDPHSITLAVGSGAAVYEEIEPVASSVPFFAGKHTPQMMYKTFDQVDELETNSSCISNILMERVVESYERPSSVPELSAAEKKHVLQGLRNRFDRADENPALRRLVPVEAHLHRLSAEEYNLKLSEHEIVEKCGSIESKICGIDAKGHETSSEWSNAYLKLCTAVVDGTSKALDDFGDALDLTAKDIEEDCSAASSYFITLELADPDELMKDNAGDDDSSQEEVMTPVSLDDEDDEDDGTGSRSIGSAGPFQFIPGPRKTKGAVREEMEPVLDEMLARPLPTLGDSDCGDSEDGGEPPVKVQDEMPLDSAINKVVEQINIEVAEALQDPYAIALVAQALMGTFAPVSTASGASSFSLSSAVGAFSRARARVFRHAKLLGPTAVAEISRILWQTLVLSVSIPTAGLAGLYGDSALYVWQQTHVLSSKGHAVLHAIKMDLKGSILSMEVHSTSDLLTVGPSFGTGSIDPRWHAYLIELQKGTCFESRTCGRNLVQRIGQRRTDNADGRRLSVSVLERRKPMPLHDGLPEASYYNCPWGTFGFLFRAGVALSVARLCVVIHFTDKASRGKGMIRFGFGDDDRDVQEDDEELEEDFEDL